MMSTRWRALPGGGGGGPAFNPPPLVDYVDEAGRVVGRCPGCYANKYQTERKVLQICRNGSPIYHVGTAVGRVWGDDVWAGGCYVPAYGATPSSGRDAGSADRVITSPAEECGGFLTITLGTNRTDVGEAPENYWSLCSRAISLVIGSLTLDDGTLVKTGFGGMGSYGEDTPPGASGGGSRQYRRPGWISYGKAGDGGDGGDGGEPADQYDPSLVADFVRSRYVYQYAKHVNSLTAPSANLNQYTSMDTTYDIGSPSGRNYNITGLIKYEGQNYAHRRNLNVAFLPRPGAYVNQVCGANVAFRDHWGWTEPFAYHGAYKRDGLIYVPFYVGGDVSELGNQKIMQCMNTSWSPIDRPTSGWNAWQMFAACPPELVPYLGLEEVEY